MRSLSHGVCGVVLVLSAATAGAFDGHAVTEGPLTLTIGEVADVTEYSSPRDVAVTVRNAGDSALEVHLRIGGLVDEFRAVGQTERVLAVAAGESSAATFRISAGRGAVSALYPVHAWAAFERAGRRRSAHAVRVFRTRFPRRPAGAEPGKLPVHVVPADGALALAGLRGGRVAWRHYDKPLVRLPVGWRGTVAACRATFEIRPIARGAVKRALVMHPPWQPGGGTIFAEYRVRLPAGGPVRLHFANAIRDHGPDEPASDGVTFRVWAGEEKLFERHTDSKRWLPGEADLGRFAGKEVLLRLESHPGPKRSTTCDSSYWAEPTIVAGEVPVPLSAARREALRRRARQVVAAGRADGKDALAFALADGYAAAAVLGPNGLADGALAFGRGRRCVVLDGLDVAVLGSRLGAWPSPLVVREVAVAPAGAPGGRARVTHRCRLAGEAFDLVVELWADGPGLRVRLRCPKRITDASVGPADQKARRVYYGHGYCLVEPEAFRAGFGGHNLSTSHVGFDFAGGMSLLTASDHPPDCLTVDPARRVYALHTHLDATLTFVPSAGGALDAAVRYQPLYDKRPAGGFRRKAGRFVFDIWGGRYAGIAETMRRMIAYGLTDSLLTVHVWQRWGYDYRLPDIHPPNPRLGTTADLRRVGEVCSAAGIPWGLHDNYIDFYPDANGYSYDHICFTPHGEPVRAWLNRSRDARSYRWRPDAFLPFLQRNLKLIRRDLAPTHYFIDVFTSIGPFDYRDKGGGFHSMLETRRCWGEAFAWIREHLGGAAPQTSEAGADQLTGYLDGADCQFLRLSPVSKRFCTRLRCKDWQRVPWFDAVLHDRFSLHGVGYSGRYEGGRGRRHHGIESDDYVSAEVLLGHALMIDAGAFGRGAVRKYWLAQDLIRRIATDRVARVAFADGDIHRQTVTWRSGARVCVNRGSADWTVDGRTLPPFGYLATCGEIASSIERIDGVIVERSRGPGGTYVNGRGFDPSGELAIGPTADRVEDLGGGRFRLLVRWDCDRPAPKDLSVFLHFKHDQADRADRIAFQGDHRPVSPTSAWTGAVTTGAGRVIQVPAAAAAGEYGIVIGLWDPAAGRRYPLRGEDAGSMSYRLGTLVVVRAGGKIAAVRLVKPPAAEPPAPRWNVAGKVIDFGPAVTAGAVRCRVDGGSIVVTPLPEMAAFAVGVRPAKLAAGRAAKVTAVHALDAAGKATRRVTFQAEGGLVTFRTRRGEFAYRLSPGGG